MMSILLEMQLISLHNTLCNVNGDVCDMSLKLNY